MAASTPASKAWPDVAAWRKAERSRLLAERMERSAEERRMLAGRAAVLLDEAIRDFAGRVVSVYFPIRGELDLRPWMHLVASRGGALALPVVVEKGCPLAFHRYRPGDRLVKGFWNIPVPERAEAVRPDILLAPLVGFAGLYRLGYGGGYFDRTLAALSKGRIVIGVGYASSELATIHPQAHDIPLDRIVSV